MVDNSFFLGANTRSTTRENVPMIDYNEDPSEDSISQSAMDSFKLDSENFFRVYGEDSPEEISKFLNKDLIDKDPERFKELYIVLLRRLCLECDKRLPLKTLIKVIEGNDLEEAEEIASFLIHTGLMDQTYERFKMLGMLPNLND